MGYVRKFFLLVLLLVGVSPAQGDDTSTRLERIEVLEVDYFYAVLSLDIFLGDGREQALAGITIDGIRSSYRPQSLRAGENTLEIKVFRENNRDSSILTEDVKIRVYDGGGSIFFTLHAPLEIQWPSAQEALPALYSGPIESRDYGDISNIALNLKLDFTNDYIVDLLKSGFPLQNLQLFQTEWRPNVVSIFLGKGLAPESVRPLLQQVARFTQTDMSVSVDSKGHVGRTSVSVGGNGAGRNYKLIPYEDVQQLRNADITMEEFLRLTGMESRSGEQRIKFLYEQAYTLIDTDGSANITRARVLLEELLTLDPQFPRAYLELARVAMKTSWPEGLDKAEELILLAREIDPDLADTRVLLGYVYTNQDRFDEAEAEYRIAEELGTDNLWLYANWGLNEKRRGNPDNAIAQYLKVLERPRETGRNDRPRRWVYRWSEMFDMLADAGRYEEADALYARYASEYQYDRCASLEQAEFRLNHMLNTAGAIDSYLKAKNRGCSRESAVLSMSHYLDWYQELERDSDSVKARLSFRQAEVFAPEDDELFYAMAASRGLQPTLRALTAVKDINHAGEYGLTALGKAANEGEVAIARSLLEAGADPDVGGQKFYFSPFFLAVQNGHDDMVELLIEFGATPGEMLSDVPELEQFLEQFFDSDTVKKLISMLETRGI